MFKRFLLISSVLISPAGAQQVVPLPTTSDIPTLQAVMQNNANNNGSHPAGTITLYPGNLTPVSGGSLKDAAGNVWTLPGMASWPAGQLTVNGQPVANGDFTVALGLDANGNVVAESAKSGQWWQVDAKGNLTPIADPFADGKASTGPLAVMMPPTTTLGSGATCTATGVPTSTPSATTSTGITLGQFSVQNGQIIDPHGQPFIPKGVDILDSTLPQVVADANGYPLLQNFPGTNMVRIAIEAGYSETVVDDAVLKLTSRGIVVQIGNYMVTQTGMSGSALAQATGWFGALAAKYRDNPYVWFSSENEPITDSNGAIGPEQQAVYQAIRGAGNNNIISFDLAGGAGTQGMDASVYGSMHNVTWDVHYYNWLANYSSDVSANTAALKNEITAAQNFAKSADGVIPVIIGEWGNSTTGSGIDPGWQAAAKAVLESGYGQTAWIYYYPGASGDELVDVGTGSVTRYGQMVAAQIGGQTSTTPPTNADCTVKVNDTTQKPQHSQATNQSTPSQPPQNDPLPTSQPGDQATISQIEQEIAAMLQEIVKLEQTVANLVPQLPPTSAPVTIPPEIPQLPNTPNQPAPLPATFLPPISNMPTAPARQNDNDADDQ